MLFTERSHFEAPVLEPHTAAVLWSHLSQTGDIFWLSSLVFFVIFMCSWVAGIYTPLFPHAHCDKLFVSYNLLKSNQPKLHTAEQRKKEQEGEELYRKL